MANSLRVPMALSLSSSTPTPTIKRRSFSVMSAAKIPMPPLNPNDPFLARLASAAANNPDLLLNKSKDDGPLPFMNLMGLPAQVERSPAVRRRPKRPPPDLPSLILDGRIVYIGMPLVPAVTELIVAELMYLQWADPVAPIYIYINSTGTTRDDGEVVASESNGFAIYDVLRVLDNEIYTLNIACAIGHACLILAAGTKGKRFTMPLAKATIHQPKITPSGLMQATDVDIHARQVLKDRDNLVKLFARHTGQTKETIANVFRSGPLHMTPARAIEFGVVDKIYWGEDDWEKTGSGLFDVI